MGYVPDGTGDTSPPQLTFKVCWLEDFGFTSDQSVIVTVERGEWVIEVELKF
ncbi:SymE family type I addiction module toxin [Dickeya dadantii]|uniref:SymE family type I addiction module toxin n=1 Tax=Dickeya dadantii TaxID=204038 RepID=UPI0008FFBE5A|nr:SymE family type I addiction module toxin [Dickeya dadantii]